MFSKVFVICAFACLASAYQGLEAPIYEYGMYQPWMGSMMGKGEMPMSQQQVVPENRYHQYWYNKYYNPMMTSYYPQMQDVPYTMAMKMPYTPLVYHQHQMPYSYPLLNKMMGYGYQNHMMMMPYQMMMQNYMMY